MSKEFNTTGTCIPEMHYMVDTSDKLAQIMSLIKKGKYLTITRPRQYGKTTTLYLLAGLLAKEPDYLVFRISFEGIDEPTYKKHQSFIRVFLDLLRQKLELQGRKELIKLITDSLESMENMSDLSRFLTRFVKEARLKVVLMVDEVDKSHNNQLFLDFLGMLRNKYLLRNEGEDDTFHSVILAGVHDVKSLKIKLRPEEERKFNSPWNIAMDINVDLGFSAGEIAGMLADYAGEKNVAMDVKRISDRIYYYTSGYPFLVSRLCTIIDAEVMKNNRWETGDVDLAVGILVKEHNPNFDTLIKNLEHYPDIYSLVHSIIIDGENVGFNLHNPVINFGVLNGIFRDETGQVLIHNRIYAQLIYSYMVSKVEISQMIGKRMA